jgi:hypothetical protein
VHKACTELDIDEGLAQSTMLAGVLDRIESATSDGQPAVFRRRRVSDTHNDFALRLVPTDAIRTLHSIDRSIRVEKACG